VKDDSKAAVLFKHYKNIQRLSLKQLEALRKGRLTNIDEFIAQKQLIIDEIKKMQPEFIMAAIPENSAVKLQQLLADIAVLEEESRKLLGGCRDAVRGRLVAAQQTKILRQAYETPLSTGRIVNRSK
jgi:hypothetical protein